MSVKALLGLGRAALCVVIAALALAAARPSQACVGTDCLQIWSTAAGGGQLTLRYDFANRTVQTYLSFPTICASDGPVCLYTAIDPGFMAPQQAESPGEGFNALLDGTKVTLEIVPPEGETTAVDAGLALSLSGRKLSKTGDFAVIGTMPNLHNHPSWQIAVPGDERGDYRISFRLTTDAPTYADSPIYTALVTNVPPPPQSPTPTPSPRLTPTGPACPGDCSADGTVVVHELVTCVNMALGHSTQSCRPCDVDHDGRVTVSELVAAVNAALRYCPSAPAVTLAQIQSTIFTPTCATQFCHSAASANAGLVLDADSAYDQLVGVPPTTTAAAAAGMLRVTAGDPAKSFLLVKIAGQPPGGQGSQMPLGLPALSPDQVDLVRQWIEQGATSE